MSFRYLHVRTLIYDFNYSCISCSEKSVCANYFPQTGCKYNVMQKVQTENEYNSSGAKKSDNGGINITHGSTPY